jgi:hypothetical protein
MLPAAASTHNAADIGTQPKWRQNESTICVCACADHAIGLYQQQQSESAGENHRCRAAELQHDGDLPGRNTTAVLVAG